MSLTDKNDMARTHEGRTVMITGGSSGLGALFARALAAAGARVVVAARRVDRLESLVEEIRSNGGEALAVPLDVRDEASVVAAFDMAEAHFGLVDTVIANAGVNSSGMAVDLPIEDFDAIQSVNCRGVFLTVREGGKRLLASDGMAQRGRIVVLASVGGLNALHGLVAYCASKASAVMLARAFAKEWVKAGISVNALCPGYMLTDINEEWFESASGKRMIERLPRSRLMPADAILPNVLHLTSDAAAYVTGSVIAIDDAQML
ncbi:MULTISPECIES: SDR family NAD(P)-dependent oxidoreductase [Novosphingobium]|uniref:NAD(P)-dependent dehydrogenase, short-chain alcohol dehydrogenase family n=1 Tax=Novosphingobium mathurense TaxID=428990 RepID=A0A1U6HV02_9SPHN|nr:MULTISPECIES: SDR family NAD(P)-dependent oxidoreductase [Novosphingobium]CDO37841.1 Short-chain dehydrogenase/reductase SDR [Novosphingobium sp. KN65.2]SLJ99579.1 NAD(P)-dependent dehydrogenase, short-chain alcohol dehydrogenase family [Novosphingobium mathurense]